MMPRDLPCRCWNSCEAGVPTLCGDHGSPVTLSVRKLRDFPSQFLDARLRTGARLLDASLVSCAVGVGLGRRGTGHPGSPHRRSAEGWPRQTLRGGRRVTPANADAAALLGETTSGAES